ncbi:NAD(P)H-hydrate epimerase [Halotydeus destructor]|nr:NAD(P)H-hydrate epimerase [Halotydeus destructor]
MNKLRMSALIDLLDKTAKVTPARIPAQRGFNTKSMKYLNQEEAIKFDQELFHDCGFSVDQLMELAGLSVASAIAKQYPGENQRNVLICCGPGNNGGDGLVAARHLKLFGYNPVIVYPKPGKGQLFENLVKQLNVYEIEVLETLPVGFGTKFDIIVDALFGFSFKPPVRPTYLSLLNAIIGSGLKIVSIDIPSGWNVDQGPPNPDDKETPLIEADMLVSLTAPKKCAQHFKGNAHWLGGRFVPEKMKNKYGLQLPPYPGTEVCCLLD